MWVVSVSWMLFVAATSGPATERSMPSPVYSRQTLFAIPFRIERDDPKASEPVAVQLQVSTDRGQSWQVHSKVPANLGRFQFRAGRDGEYWFVVQTIDNEGRLRPAQPGIPGMRVIIDTTSPQLELEARRGPNGEISVRWRITETNLDPKSARILYRTEDSSNLQSVALDRRQLEVPRAVRTGDVSWWLPARANRAEIRAEVRDLAGNVAVGHAQVNLKEPAVARGAAPPSPATALSRASGPPVSLPPRAAAPPGRWQGATEEATPPPWQQLTPPKPAAETPSTEEPVPVLGPQFGRPAARMPRPVHPVSQSAPEASVAIQINPTIGRRFSTEELDDSESGQQRPCMVNSRVFELDYAIEEVGPSGIASVELWGTRDGGQTWKSFGLDDDKRSPFLVHLEEEGKYGFRVAVRSGAGLGGEPPQSGDAPDLWIALDLTKPEARILTAEQVPGKGGEILIRWEAQDQALAPQPVALLYSATPGGPWQTIAAHLDNSGQYAWSIGRDVPGQVYLRIEVRDAAGNLGIFESPQMIAVDRTRPSGRIRDIRPVSPSSSARVHTLLPRR